MTLLDACTITLEKGERDMEDFFLSVLSSLIAGIVIEIAKRVLFAKHKRNGEK